MRSALIALLVAVVALAGVGAWTVTNAQTPLAACSDGIDNEGDGLVDFPADLGCTDAADLDEVDPPACSDGRDNDGDGLSDFPADFGCLNTLDTNEVNPPACSDGRDNDGDGRIDFPNDLGCVSTTDNNEVNPPPAPACRDGRDNDGDGLIDFPNDPGCGSYDDPDEADGYRCTSNCQCAASSVEDPDSSTGLLSCTMSGGYSLCPANQQTCSLNTYSRINPVSGEPETVQGYQCPSGTGNRCVLDGGVHKCSGNTCVDPATVPITREDPTSPFPENTGTVTPDGNCLGTIRMFGGSGKRCRRAGTQTAFQNCCDNNLPILEDTTGKPGEPNQQDYRKEATDFEIFSNQCDIEDQETAQLAESGYCIDLGSYCAERWALVGCVQRARGYCCFNSRLARIIQEQGRAQLTSKPGFGSAENPNCEGFTPEEFQALDFSKMDLSEYEDAIQTQAESVMGQRMRDEAQQSYGN